MVFKTGAMLQRATQLRLLLHPGSSPAWLAQSSLVLLQTCSLQPQKRRAGKASKGVWKAAHGSSIRVTTPLRALRREQSVLLGA